MLALEGQPRVGLAHDRRQHREVVEDRIERFRGARLVQAVGDAGVARLAEPRADVDVLVAEVLQERGRLAAADAPDDGPEVLAARTLVGSDAVEQRHAQHRPERQRRPCVVGVGVIDHLEALLAQPGHEVGIVEPESGAQRIR